jgi:alcohol dehydrogenase (cytochrome c)
MNSSAHLFLVCLAAAGMAFAQAPASTPTGLQSFQRRCVGCHGTDGNGGEHGPSILRKLQSTRSDQDLVAFLHKGIPLRGMPAFAIVPDPEMTVLVGLLRTLTPKEKPAAVKFPMQGGTQLEGFVIGMTGREVQMRTADSKIHLLRKVGANFREATSQRDWPNLHGQFSGNRDTPMTQINKTNLGQLAPRWVFPVPNSGQLQATPQVVGGIMYVPTTNTVIALDAGTGAHLWTFTRPPTEGLLGNARGVGNNRSVSIAGDRVFMQMDNAHLLALNRFTGEVLWDTEMADWHMNFNTTGSLLAVENLVVAGTAGGEEGVRGFVAAYDQNTGKEVWRFWTIPAPGEKGSETWDGRDIAHGGGTTWLTGSYDPESKTIFWPTGNAGPDFNGDNRKGDNLYTCSILAIDVSTGKLKWAFQATPHDEWDWDAVQPLVLVDTVWQGSPRKLLLQANRNGFLYVLDRNNGKLLLAKPLVKKMTWAKEIAPDGRPVMNPNQVPTVAGTTVCPPVEGATNFFSTSFSAATGLYYVNTLERCAVYTKRPPADWVAGTDYQAGGGSYVPNEKGQKFLRAYDIQTGKVAWEIPQEGEGWSWTGTLSTASGLVFFGDDAGALAAADAATGKRLWSYPFAEFLHTSPMTYMFDNKQYIGIAVGSQVYAFALPE